METAPIGHHLNFSRKNPHATFDQMASLNNTGVSICLRALQSASYVPYTERDIVTFHTARNAHQVPLDAIAVHGSYIMNALTDDPQKVATTRKTMSADAHLCEQLNLPNFVIHPGYCDNHRTCDYEHLGDAVRYVNERYPDVCVLVENMTGGRKGCSTFDQITMGVEACDGLNSALCFDTCHAFAAGYDLRDKTASVVQEYEEKVGWNNVSLIHLNDSKTPCGSRVDRHENLFEGYISGCMCDDDPDGKCDCGNDFLSEVNRGRLSQIPRVFEPPKKDGEPILFDIRGRLNKY